MNVSGLPPGKTALLFGLTALALAGLTGLAFAGWVEHGADIFMAMAQSGLSWCF